MKDGSKETPSRLRPIGGARICSATSAMANWCNLPARCPQSDLAATAGVTELGQDRFPDCEVGSGVGSSDVEAGTHAGSRCGPSQEPAQAQQLLGGAQQGVVVVGGGGPRAWGHRGR